MTGCDPLNETTQDVLDLSLDLAEGENRKIDIVNLFRTTPLKVTGTITLGRKASLEIVEVDLGRFSMDLQIRTSLAEKAGFLYKLAALNENAEAKSYRADVIHIGRESKSLTSMFGVCSGTSHMEFLGVSDIKRGAAKANTRQEGKAVTLSGKARCIVSPALLIGEEDVFASHGASMGSVPDTDIFYLMSRGLDRNTAERLVMVGYLKPIVLMLDDKTVKEKALALLEKEI